MLAVITASAFDLPAPEQYGAFSAATWQACTLRIDAEARGARSVFVCFRDQSAHLGSMSATLANRCEREVHIFQVAVA